MTQELLEFPGGVLGVALNLDEHSIGAVILGDFEKIEEGQQVKRTGEVLSVPVGDAFLGRVVNPLGPADRRPGRHRDRHPPRAGAAGAVGGSAPGGQRAAADRHQGHRRDDPDRPWPAPADHRRPQDRQDRGLRRHHPQPARGVGDRRPQAAGALRVRRDRPEGHHDRQRQATRSKRVARWSTPPSSRRPASDSAGFKWLAPYTGSAIGQHWMYDGKHVLIVFDDLSKQADAYRAISLLLRRPPGREAYPGDVFYLHSRLLERCAKLSDELGGGSMTGLPIIETKANDISAFIPTNVISITDGQCFLESDLFNQGVRPAINVGVSVSRVGGAAQIKAMKEVAGSLRLDLSQYRELEAFAAFASDLDADVEGAARARRAAGGAAQAAAVQPMSVEEQVVAIFLGTKGHLDRFRWKTFGDSRPSSSSTCRLARGHLQGHPGDQEALRGDRGEADRRRSTSSRRASPPPTAARWSSTRPRPRRWTKRTSRRNRSRSASRPRRSRESELHGSHIARIARTHPSAGSIKKITKAQELIATSRIAKAQARVQAARPYSDRDHQHADRAGECQRAGPPAARRAGEPRARRRAGGVVATAACAAPTTPTCSRRSEELFALLRDEGKEPVLYMVGRKALGYYNFRNCEVDGVVDRVLGAADVRARPRDRRHPGRRVHVGRRRRRRRSG